MKPAFEQQVHTYHLVAIGKALKDALSKQMAPEAVVEVVERCVHGECPQCGFELMGKDLLALARDQTPIGSRKLALFRDGYCGSYDCNSYYYSLAFHPHPGVDWDCIRPALDAATTPVFLVEEKIRVPIWKTISRRTQMICLTVIMAGLLLGVVRQVYNGGQIPLFREARHFRVVPFRAGESLP
jgi:hypothetical protein